MEPISTLNWNAQTRWLIGHMNKVCTLDLRSWVDHGYGTIEQKLPWVNYVIIEILLADPVGQSSLIIGGVRVFLLRYISITDVIVIFG